MSARFGQSHFATTLLLALLIVSSAGWRLKNNFAVKLSVDLSNWCVTDKMHRLWLTHALGVAQPPVTCPVCTESFCNLLPLVQQVEPQVGNPKTLLYLSCYCLCLRFHFQQQGNLFTTSVTTQAFTNCALLHVSTIFQACKQMPANK